MNTVYAMPREEFEAERLRLQSCADQHLLDHLPRPEYATERDALIDAGVKVDIEDAEIIDAMVEAFDLTRAEAIDRLAQIDFAKAREVEP